MRDDVLNRYLTGILCPVCFGAGEVSLPPVRLPLSYNPHEDFETYECPLCKGRGEIPVLVQAVEDDERGVDLIIEPDPVVSDEVEQGEDYEPNVINRTYTNKESPYGDTSDIDGSYHAVMVCPACLGSGEVPGKHTYRTNDYDPCPLCNTSGEVEVEIYGSLYEHGPEFWYAIYVPPARKSVENEPAEEGDPEELPF